MNFTIEMKGIYSPRAAGYPNQTKLEEAIEMAIKKIVPTDTPVIVETVQA